MAKVSTHEAARAAGIAVMTLHRWVAAERIKAPKLSIRDNRTVRLWSKADVDRIAKVKQTIYCKGRGRKKGYNRKKK